MPHHLPLLVLLSPCVVRIIGKVASRLRWISLLHVWRRRTEVDMWWSCGRLLIRWSGREIAICARGFVVDESERDEGTMVG
ncbi:hypothetical protein PENTCL1PPCAC_30648, partial [Pristionchus entomophagus]